MSVTYYTGSGQSSFSTAATIGLPVWEQVVPEPNAKVCFRQAHMILAASYSPLALNTTYSAAGSYGVPTASTYYLVSEENFTDERGGMMKFDRRWCAVPTTWFDFEDHAFTYPGYVVPVSVGTRGVSQFPSEGTNYWTVAYTASGVNVGDMFYIDHVYTRNSVSYRINQFTRATAVVANTSINIPKIFPGTGAFSSSFIFATLASPGRSQPETVAVPSRIQHDYVLTSATGIEADLPIIERFQPVDTTGTAVSYLNTSTTPTSAAYAQNLAYDAMLVAECVRERFLGNIYVRKTRLVPAM